MLLIHYHSLPEGTTLPIDQRWRTLELNPDDFPGLDLTTAQGITAAIRRINDGKLSFTGQIPYGADCYLTDTSTADHWQLSLQIIKAT